jgi:hypothetical protein
VRLGPAGIGAELPRLVGDAAGLVVSGVYAAMLALERERNERSDRIAARMMAEHGRCFRRNSRPAEQLEAGEAVVVDRVRVEPALWERDRPPAPVRLPLARGVKRVRLTADDRVIPVVDARGGG